MNKIRIVTDSSAHFLDPTLVARYKITVVPNTITFSDQRFREGIDMDAASFFRLASSGSIPTLIPPTVEQFASAYAALHRETDRILSIHVSRAMNATCDNAQKATLSLAGRCTIYVLDLMTASVGLGMLVEMAARLAETTNSVEQLARTIRKQVGSVYSVFYTELFAYLQRAGLVSESQAILGDMLGIKPFVTIEDGEMLAMEKVRTRAQATDRFVEFAAEFAATDRTVILHAGMTPNEHVYQLRERLSTELGWPPCLLAPYNPSLATYIGTDALGLVVQQREESA